ncbi:MAG: glycosyltransferase family 4 protein [Anaerolineae bacterium]|nr:glycosyltransferase family 4 protein [Anaerolineae bacterium]
MTEQKLRILYVVIGNKDVPLTIQNADDVAHVCPRQLKQGVERLGYEADYFPIGGTFSRWNYVKAAAKFFMMSLRGELDKYDIIHAHYGFHGVVARCQFRRPLVLTLMGSDAYRKWERLIARVLVHFVSAVIVPGGQMAALIDDYPVDVIPYGTDVGIFKPMDMMSMREKLGLPKDKKLVLFPYNPTRVFHKRPDVIKAAVEQIEGAEMLVIYGKTSEQVAEYMNASDVLAMASEYEGSPGTIREALACNVPIVSVDVADVKMHIGDVEGCYMCEREPNDMAAKLRLAFADNKRLTRGREKALPFSLEACAERTIEVYRRVLAKHKKPA